MELPVGHLQPTLPVVPVISRENAENLNTHTSSEENVFPNLEDVPWTTVSRRACSLESFDMVRRSRSRSNGPTGLTRDQTQTVAAAADALLTSQKA